MVSNEPGLDFTSSRISKLGAVQAFRINELWRESFSALVKRYCMSEMLYRLIKRDVEIVVVCDGFDSVEDSKKSNFGRDSEIGRGGCGY